MCPLDVKKINYPWKCKHAMLKAITSHIFHHEWGIEVVGEFPFGKESYGFWKCLNRRVVLIMPVPISLRWYTLRIHPLFLESQPKIVYIQLCNSTKFYNHFKHVVFYFRKRCVEKKNRGGTWELEGYMHVLDNIVQNIFCTVVLSNAYSIAFTVTGL